MLFEINKLMHKGSFDEFEPEYVQFLRLASCEQPMPCEVQNDLMQNSKNEEKIDTLMDLIKKMEQMQLETKNQMSDL